MRRLRHATLLIAATSAAVMELGCYSYAPPLAPDTMQGRRVNLSLTDSGSVVLAPHIGPGIIAVDGLLRGDSANTYLVDLVVTRERNGAEVDWHGERVAVSHALVSSLQLRTFSAPRSVFASALAAIGIAAITAALRGPGENGGGVGAPGGKPVPQ
jgi:hypothetical protein